MGDGVTGYNNQKIAAEQEAELIETANTTSNQAPYKAELVTGTNRSEYLMRKLTFEEKDTVERALSRAQYCHRASIGRIYAHLRERRVKEN